MACLIVCSEPIDCSHSLRENDPQPRPFLLGEQVFWAGVPTVASIAASSPEVIGDAGILLDPDDVVKWAQALEQVISDAALRDRLITAGHERVRALTWDAAARDTLAVYRELSQGTPP